MFRIIIDIMLAGIEWLEAGGQNNGAHLKFHLFIHLGVIDGSCGAKIRADLAVTGKEMGTFGSIYGRNVGNGLSIGHIDGFSSSQSLIIFRWYWLYLFRGYLGELDMAGRADKVTGATGHTRIRMGVERGRHLHFCTATGKIYRPSTYPLAHSNAQPTKNAGVIIQFEFGFIDSELLGKFFNEVVVGAAGQQQFNDHLSVAADLLAVGLDLHALPDRVVA
jgi:hypothetical protein